MTAKSQTLEIWDDLNQGLWPVIVATFGENRLICQTLVDTGVDVNTMPLHMFQSIRNLTLVPQKGDLVSFVSDQENYLGYANIPIFIQDIQCSHRFYIMDTNFTLQNVTLGQSGQRKYHAYPDWCNDRVYFSVASKVTYQQFLIEDQLEKVPTTASYQIPAKEPTRATILRESPPVQLLHRPSSAATPDKGKTTIAEHEAVLTMTISCEASTSTSTFTSKLQYIEKSATKQQT